MGSYVESVSTIVLESIIERPVDIVLCMAQAPLSARALEELRKRGIVTVLWFVEDYLRFTYWKELAKHYDYVFTIQKGDCIEALKAAGAREVHYLPPAADPLVHLPVGLSAEEKARWGSPISFVGAGYHNRVHLFAALAEMPLKIWGTEWPECRPFDKLVQEKGRRLTPNEYIKIFNATEININLHSSTERDGVDPYGDFINPRTFELAAAGAFQLVDERSLLSELFTPGEDIITFNSLDDLKEKIAYYMAHPEERAIVAQKARQRVLKEHTYEHRLTKMLEIIYQGSYDKIKTRLDQSPWKRMMRRAEASDIELLNRMKVSFERGEEANLDGLVADIVTGNGKLSEVEKKLLFLFHVKKQIVRMAYEEPDPAVKRGV
jgi:spore maturation protein CgeB